MRMRAHVDIAALLRRMQERFRRAHAQPAVDGALAVGHAFLDRAVVIRISGDAEADRAFHEGFAERILPLHGGDGERSFVAAIGVVALANAALHPLEVRHHVRIAPAAIAHLRPGIEILALAAIVDEAVN